MAVRGRSRWRESDRVVARHPFSANADVAQLVAHHLAKVRVAGSNPVVRSEGSHGLARPPRWGGREARQRPAKPCTRVQIPSPPRREPRAIGAAGARFLDTEEVTGSIPVSPTKVLAGQRLVTGLSVTSRCCCVPYCGSRMGAQDHLVDGGAASPHPWEDGGFRSGGVEPSVTGGGRVGGFPA